MNSLEKLSFCFGITAIIQSNNMRADPTNSKQQIKTEEFIFTVLDKLTSLMFSPKAGKILKEMQISKKTQVDGLRRFIIDLYEALFIDDLPIDLALEEVQKKRKELP